MTQATDADEPALMRVKIHERLADLHVAAQACAAFYAVDNDDTARWKQARVLADVLETAEQCMRVVLF